MSGYFAYREQQVALRGCKGLENDLDGRHISFEQDHIIDGLLNILNCLLPLGRNQYYLDHL